MGYDPRELNGITKKICHFIKTTQYEDIPPAVIERAKMIAMHTVGVSLCSAELPLVKDAIEIAKEMSAGGEGVATAWADGKKISWEAASFIAGAMGDTLDWEDCSVTGHPSAGIITTAIIAGEVLKKSGKDVLTAIVLGYEIYQRIALSGGMNIAGYNLYGNLVVLMKLLDLSEEQMNKAFGVGAACATIPGNVHECTMSDSLDYLYGLKNETAITIIKGVMAGVDGMMDIFDCPSSYLDHTRAPNPSWFTKELGETWQLINMILVKNAPCNMYVQTYAYLASQHIKKHGFNPDDVEEIILSPSVEIRHWANDVGYKSLTQAQFSIPYVTACCMYNPEPGAKWYQVETMTDPKIVALMNKVKAEYFVDTVKLKSLKGLMEGKHPEKFMTVRMKDGTEYVESAFTHPGHPSYMHTRETFQDNFRMETKYVLAPEKIEKAIEFFTYMDRYDDVSALAEYLY